MNNKDKNRMIRIIYQHGSPKLIDKYEEWQRGIAKSPEYKEIDRITAYIRKELTEKLNQAEADEIDTGAIKGKMQAMRKERNRVIKAIYHKNPHLEQLKNEVTAEVNNIMRQYQNHRNSPHWNAEQIQRQARQLIADKADMLNRFSEVDAELHSFQQCIEKYNEMQDVNPMIQTAKTIAEVPFWTNQRKEYEQKLDRWLKDKETPDPIIKSMPKELFDRVKSEFAHENWSEHTEAEQRLQEIVPFMLDTVQKWAEERTRGKKTKKKDTDDKKARTKADEPQQIL